VAISVAPSAASSVCTNSFENAGWAASDAGGAAVGDRVDRGLRDDRREPRHPGLDLQNHAIGVGRIEELGGDLHLHRVVTGQPPPTHRLPHLALRERVHVEGPVPQAQQHFLVLLLHGLLEGGLHPFRTDEVTVVSAPGNEDDSPVEHLGHDGGDTFAQILGLDVIERPVASVICVISMQRRATAHKLFLLFPNNFRDINIRLFPSPHPTRDVWH